MNFSKVIFQNLKSHLFGDLFWCVVTVFFPQENVECKCLSQPDFKVTCLAPIAGGVFWVRLQSVLP